jgi:casein kinase II subunit beta
VDGAFFGTTFPHLLFQTYRELAPSPIAPAGTNYSSLNTQSNPPKSTNGTTRETSAEGSASEAQGSTSADRRASTSTAPSGAAPLTAPTLQQSLLGQRSPQARLYTPRIYGFRVSEQSKSGPRMRWMRMRPESFEELDQGIVSTSSGKATATSTTVTAGSKASNSNAAKGESTAVEGQDTNMASQPAHSVTSDGRSTATGRPMAGRAPSLTVPSPNL